jgi:large subunit ribosomal protein L32e
MSQAVRRKDSHKFHKLGMKIKAKRKWRKAKGRHNKIRKGKRGHSSRPKIGFGGEEYKKPATIENIAQLATVNKNTETMIAGRVGGKKRAQILAKAKEMGITIINPRKETQ